MNKNLEDGAEFYSDLEANDLKNQADKFLHEVFLSEEDEQKLLLKARKENHIIDQWYVFLNNYLKNNNKKCFRWSLKL